MRESRGSIKLEEISEVLNKAPGDSHWFGAEAEEIVNILEKLPLELPKDGKYFFEKAGDILRISEESRGISIHRINDVSVITGMDIQDDGLYLSVRGIRGITAIALLKNKAEIPSKAKSFQALGAPLDLLDEYADLRLKTKSQGLNAADRERQKELLELIGQEFQKKSRHKTIPSSRSTPISSGESRSSGYGSTGGG